MQGSGFRVQVSGFRVQGSGVRVQGSGFRVQGSGFRVQGSGERDVQLVRHPAQERPASIHEYLSSLPDSCLGVDADDDPPKVWGVPGRWASKR